MSSRILVDLLGYTGARGGTETYARELLPRVGDRMPAMEFIGLVNRPGADLVRPFFPGAVREVSWVRGDRASWAAGEVAAVETAARRVRADLIWSPANFGPIVTGTRRVATIHDVIYHEVSGGAGDRALRAMTSWLMARSARSANAVITVSHAAAASIVTQLGVNRDRVHVVHNGSAPPTPVAAPWQSLRGVIDRPTRPLLLSTGNRMPHKNFDGLLRALASLPASQRPLTVIPGSHGRDPLMPLVADLGLHGDVVLPGWVTSAQLEALYAVADLYVCPSLVEGFGLPVVDALRRGCPVLANDVAVLREVGGDAAWYADATVPERLAAAIATALASPDDPSKRSARVRWASRFTWDSAADKTAAVLTRTLSDSAETS